MLGLKKKPGTQQTQQTQQTQRAVSHTQQEKVWKIGDYYDVDGKRGVVFAVTPDGKHGKILSLTKTSANWDAAKSWCRNLGNGWRLASKDELIVMYRHKRTLNSILQAVGDVFGYNGCYWTLDERGSDSAWTVYMSDGSTYNYRKSNNGYVRAVSAF